MVLLQICSLYRGADGFILVYDVYKPKSFLSKKPGYFKSKATARIITLFPA